MQALEIVINLLASIRTETGLEDHAYLEQVEQEIAIATDVGQLSQLAPGITTPRCVLRGLLVCFECRV